MISTQYSLNTAIENLKKSCKEKLQDKQEISNRNKQVFF